MCFSIPIRGTKPRIARGRWGSSTPGKGKILDKNLYIHISHCIQYVFVTRLVLLPVFSTDFREDSARFGLNRNPQDIQKKP